MSRYIKEGSLEELSSVFELYKNDFAPCEQKTYEHLKKLINKGNYRLLLLKDSESSAIISYMLLYLDRPRALWVDYLAVSNEHRGTGIGTEFINLIAEKYKPDYKGIFFEVEKPDSKNELTLHYQKKRIKFYERLGAKRLEVSYKLPTREGDLPMLLYFLPLQDISFISQDFIWNSICAEHDEVHSDIEHMQSVRKSFEHTIAGQKI